MRLPRSEVLVGGLQPCIDEFATRDGIAGQFFQESLNVGCGQIRGGLRDSDLTIYPILRRVVHPERRAPWVMTPTPQ
jgi:hypothetical protein